MHDAEELPHVEEVPLLDFNLVPCKCGHSMFKHLHIDVGGDGKEYDRCTLCPCRVFRPDPNA
jgi:hypothetical protein